VPTAARRYSSPTLELANAALVERAGTPKEFVTAV